MWEICLVLKTSQKQYADYIISKLNRFSSLILVTMQNSHDQINIYIACQQSIKNKFTKVLSGYIADVIILLYKEQFYTQNLNLYGMSKICEKALIKALCLFDIEDDKQTIKHYLHLKSYLDINSFYSFQLTELKSKWKAIIDLAKANSYYFFNSQIYIEILKFLVGSLPHKYANINILYRQNEFVLLDDCYKPIDQNLLPESLSTEIGLLTNLIYLSPEKINITCIDNISRSTFSIIYNIFNQTINLSI